MKKILIFTRCTWTLVNFRHDYIKFLENKKCNITIACDYRKQELKNLKKKFPSVSFKKINFLNKNRSIFREFKICYQIIKLLIMEKFNYIHNFTIRPVIYSTLIGKILFRLPISDILYTFVMGDTQKILNLKLQQKDFTLCVELPIKAKKNGLRISDAPANEKSRIGGTKKVNELKDGFLILLHMIKLFFKNER